MSAIEMNNGNLDKAKELLEAAGRAEGAENTSYERERMAQKIKLWENVKTTWLAVQTDIQNRKYNLANRKLSSMNHEDYNAWTWPGGNVEKKKAFSVKKLLDARSSALAVLKNENSTIDNVRAIKTELSLAISETSQIKATYIEQLLADTQPILKNVEKTINDDSDLQAALELLNNPQPDYQAIISRLQKISKESRGPVKSRADTILPAILILHRETQQMQLMIDKICDMDFEAVNKFELNLPEDIDWSAEKNIGSLRRNLIETVDSFKDAALQLSLLHQNLETKGIVIGQTVPALEVFLQQKYLDKLYNFDCLDMPLPKNSRPEPAGVYDELLGIDFFYDFVSNVGNPQMVALPVDNHPFIPKLYTARDIILEVEKFTQFANQAENQWFNRGNFAKYLEHCQQILALRDKIIDKHLQRHTTVGSREFIVSRGIAVYLLPDGKRHSELSEQLKVAFAANKKEILKQGKAYTLAMPEEALKIRLQIIQTGLPGDSVVKKMWQQRPASGWGEL